MPLIQEIPESDDRLTQHVNRPSDMFTTIRELSKRLALPEDLLPSFMADDPPYEALRIYSDHAEEVLGEIRDTVKEDEETWRGLELEELAEIALEILRLYGGDPWTNQIIQDQVDDILSPFDNPLLALHLLSTSLRYTFSSTAHPHLNPSTSRALSRPLGGPQALSDFNDSPSQLFKSPPHWGTYNVLSWCASQFPSTSLEKHIGLILPPTLVLMDDWEPAWRGRGISVLSSWIDHFEVGLMRRMGVDKLLLKSLIHTISLHSDPPLKGTLGVALRLIDRSLEGKEKMHRYEQIMERGLVDGWMFGKGRAVMCNLSEMLEEMCKVLGVGIARWMKTIIPNLLQPLQYTPSPSVLPHYKANLRALICVMKTLKGFGRTARWRGQIVNVLGRLWVQLGESILIDSGDETGHENQVGDLVKQVFGLLAEEHPQIKEGEYKTLLALDPKLFGGLVCAA